MSLMPAPDRSPSEPSTPSLSSLPRISVIDACILLAAAAILVAFRLRAFDLPLENDECNYAYIARRLLAGDRLYIDVWDHQPFGIFAMLAGVIALFGDAPRVFRWTACAFSIVSLCLIFDITRRVTRDLIGCVKVNRITDSATRWSGAIAALLFALVSSDPGTAGEGCQREIYMNTLILAAWWLALQPQLFGVSAPPLTKGGLGGVFSAGVMLGLASTLKTVVAVHWFVLATWLCWMVLQSQTSNRLSANDPTPLPRTEGGEGLDVGHLTQLRRTGSTLVAFAIGPALIWASAFAYFAVTNRWHEFLDAVFLFNLGYSESNGLLSRFAEFFAPLYHRFIAPMNPPPRFPFTLDSALPLWLLGFVSAGLLAFAAMIRPRRAGKCGTGFQPVRNCGTSLLLALIAASYLATCLPGRFWPHYYYLMIPPVVLITVIAPIALWEWWAMPTLQDASTCDADQSRDRADQSRDRKGAVLSRSEPAQDDNPPTGTNHKRKRVVDGLQTPVEWASPTIVRLSMTLIVSATAFFQYRHYLSQPLFGLTVNRFNSRDFWGRAQGANIASVTDPDDKIFVFGNDAELYYYANRRCASRYTMITGLSAKLPGAERRRTILLDELRKDPPRLILVLFDEDPFPQWLDFLREFYSDPVGWDFHDRTHKPIAFILARKDRPIREINWNWDRAEVGGWAIGER